MLITYRYINVTIRPSDRGMLRCLKDFLWSKINFLQLNSEKSEIANHEFWSMPEQILALADSLKVNFMAVVKIS